MHIHNSFSLYWKLFFTSRLFPSSTPNCSMFWKIFNLSSLCVYISLIVSYSWIWFYAIEIILELNNWENSISSSSSSSRWMSYCNKFHSPSHAIHAIFEWLWKAIHGEVSEEWGEGERERQNENVGNAKLESEKLIQQVFIMHAC